MRFIAGETKEVAVLTRRDSTDMRTIALVTLTFLPGTFTAVGLPMAPSKKMQLKRHRLSSRWGFLTFQIITKA